MESGLLGCGREDGLIVELTHNVKRHLWLSESLLGGIVLGTKLRVPFVFPASPEHSTPDGKYARAGFLIGKSHHL